MTLKEQFRAIILVIAAMMLYCTSAAADTSATSGKCGDHLTWNYNSTDSVLTISGTGKMWGYYYEKSIITFLPYTTAPWADLNFKKVVIEQGVISIGYGAFAGCLKLTNISIPSSVVLIGESAFWGCSGLTSISLPSGVTSIDRDAFKDCTGLTSISLPSSLTLIEDEAFYCCRGLTSINIPGSVVLIGDYAFAGCSGLTSISIPGSVTSIGSEVFRGCSGLTSVNISNGASIGYGMFSGCTGLTNISISGSVTSIGDWAFSGCTSLTSISIPSSVCYIRSTVFSGCTGLTSISIPSSVTDIWSKAFYECSGLKTINMLAKTPPYCYSDVFDGVDKQKCELVVPEESVELYKSTWPWSYFYKITAGIDAAKADRVSVAAVGGEIAVTGADGDAVVEVYGVNGMLVYRGKDKSVPVPSAGVYVVRVADKTVKVTVN